MGALGMHGWMACLQQMALVPGLGQQILPLAQPPLDDPLITYIIKQQTWKTHNHQSPSNGTQATFKF